MGGKRAAHAPLLHALQQRQHSRGRLPEACDGVGLVEAHVAGRRENIKPSKPHVQQQNRRPDCEDSRLRQLQLGSKSRQVGVGVAESVQQKEEVLVPAVQAV